MMHVFLQRSWISTLLIFLFSGFLAQAQVNSIKIDLGNPANANNNSGNNRQDEKELELICANGGEIWEVGKQPKIEWRSKNVLQVGIEYSINSGENWNTVVSFLPATSGSYAWSIPSTVSNECLIRIYDTFNPAIADTSEHVFRIIEESSESYRIVVLGSSTAAGNGPTVKDSAWVWRYREYLSEKDTRFEVINLAKGGYTTYNLLPTGTAITGVSETIDTERNITKALSYSPKAVIINLPSNDANKEYPVKDQLVNYELIADAAATGNALLWVTTPQPRNNFTALKTQMQFDLLDSTFSIFGDFAIDFWNGFNETDGGLKDDYNSGDGIHMNNLGHRTLFERVVDKSIPSHIINHSSPTSTQSLKKHMGDNFTIYPNPAHSYLNLKFADEILNEEKLRLKIYSLSGRLFKQPILPNNQAEQQIDISDLDAGIWLLLVDGDKLSGSRYFIKQ